MMALTALQNIPSVKERFQGDYRSRAFRPLERDELPRNLQKRDMDFFLLVSETPIPGGRTRRASKHEQVIVSPETPHGFGPSDRADYETFVYTNQGRQIKPDGDETVFLVRTREPGQVALLTGPDKDIYDTPLELEMLLSDLYEGGDESQKSARKQLFEPALAFIKQQKNWQ